MSVSTTMHIPKQLGRVLKGQRKLQQFTQKKAAEQVGLLLKTISSTSMCWSWSGLTDGWLTTSSGGYVSHKKTCDTQLVLHRHCATNLTATPGSRLSAPCFWGREMAKRTGETSSRLRCFSGYYASPTDAENFSVFIEAHGRFRLTPIYDVLSAYPILGRGRTEPPTRASSVRKSAALSYIYKELPERSLRELQVDTGICEAHSPGIRAAVSIHK